jgi:(R,R)-butanediol dehydrogenase/meso-butanediol dehydrogenase/diacetyl reductase
MRALRYHGPRDLRLDDVPEPGVRPGTVKIQVGAAGICGSDIHEYVGGPISVPMSSPHPLTGETAPVVFGHELAGTVTEIGPGVTRVDVGDRVAVNAALSCGRCDSCARGWTNVCRSIGFHGVTGGGGGFAAFDVVPESNLHLLPDEISDEVGALLEPLATGFHAVDLSGARQGDGVLVLGAGPVGLMVVLACVAAGIENIVVAEPSATRRSLAAAFGATRCLDPRTESVVDVTHQETRGTGAAAAVDAAAAPTSLADAVASTRPRGTIVNIAAWEKPTPFDPTTLLFRETLLRGSLAYTAGDFDRGVAFAADHAATLERLITRVIGLDDVITEGFDRLAFERHDDIKVLVRPGAAPSAASTAAG